MTATISAPINVFIFVFSSALTSLHVHNCGSLWKLTRHSYQIIWFTCLRFLWQYIHAQNAKTIKFTLSWRSNIMCVSFETKNWLYENNISVMEPCKLNYCRFNFYTSKTRRSPRHKPETILSIDSTNKSRNSSRKNKVKIYHVFL